MEDKSKQVQEKVLSLVPSGHEPVTVKVDLIFLEKNPFYKIELYSRADKIDFMPKWVNIHVSWEFVYNGIDGPRISEHCGPAISGINGPLSFYNYK